jgi:hypothetical protein
MKRSAVLFALCMTIALGVCLAAPDSAAARSEEGRGGHRRHLASMEMLDANKKS